MRIERERQRGKKASSDAVMVMESNDVESDAEYDAVWC
jgi:hypothetical protein